MGVRERLDSMSRVELGGLVVVLAAILVAAAVWYVRALPKPVAITATAPGGVTAAASSSPTPTPILVDVAGAVREPGVYGFVLGDRVIDAIERAGGARRAADLSALNLAAPLADGTQILVPQAGATASGAAAAATGTTAGGLINVNTADATTLEELSGIGEVLAAAIVSYRDEHGPFTSVEQLMDVSGIGPATLEEIRDQVTV